MMRWRQWPSSDRQRRTRRKRTRTLRETPHRQPPPLYWQWRSRRRWPSMGRSRWDAWSTSCVASSSLAAYTRHCWYYYYLCHYYCCCRLVTLLSCLDIRQWHMMRIPLRNCVTTVVPISVRPDYYCCCQHSILLRYSCRHFLSLHWMTRRNRHCPQLPLWRTRRETSF